MASKTLATRNAGRFSRLNPPEDYTPGVFQLLAVVPGINATAQGSTLLLESPGAIGMLAVELTCTAADTVTALPSVALEIAEDSADLAPVQQLTAMNAAGKVYRLRIGPVLRAVAEEDEIMLRIPAEATAASLVLTARVYGAILP